MIVPATTDVCQHKDKLKIPEIRVWCHPHAIGQSGDDYFETFGTFERACDFIKKNSELSEPFPLIAYDGYELNIFEMQKQE